MMKISICRRVLAVCILVFAATGLASANLINNGDFETNNFSGWTVTTAGLGSNIFVGQFPGYHGASAGVFFGAPGTQNDSISQTFATTAGATYDLSFYLQIGPTGQPANNVFEVLFNGVVVYSLLNSNPGFATLTLSGLLATGGMTTLEFRGRNGVANDFLDDVVLNAATGSGVPETGNSVMLLGLALVGMAGARRALRVS